MAMQWVTRIGSARQEKGFMNTHHQLKWFQLHGEGALNWLALGLLLAAWNLSNDDAIRTQHDAGPARPGSGVVTVRTLGSASAVGRGGPGSARLHR